MNNVNLRRRMNRKRKKFNRTEYNKYGKLKAGVWRAPKGKKSKMRKHVGGVRTVNIGFRNPVDVRGNHYSGLPEVMIYNTADLEGLKGVIVRIGGSVGMKKREEIQKKAEQLKIRVVNKKETKKGITITKKKEVKKDEPKTTEKASK